MFLRMQVFDWSRGGGYDSAVVTSAAIRIKYWCLKSAEVVLIVKDGRTCRFPHTSWKATKVSPMFHLMSFQILLNRWLSIYYKIWFESRFPLQTPRRHAGRFCLCTGWFALLGSCTSLACTRKHRQNGSPLYKSRGFDQLSARFRKTWAENPDQRCILVYKRDLYVTA